MMRLPKDWTATLVLGITSSLLAAATIWALGKLSLVTVIQLVYMTLIAGVGIFWGKRIGRRDSELLIKSLRDDNQMIQQQYDHRIESLNMAIVDLKKWSVLLYCQKVKRVLVLSENSIRVSFFLNCYTNVTIERIKVTLHNFNGEGILDIPSYGDEKFDVLDKNVKAITFNQYIQDPRAQECLQKLCEARSEVMLTLSVDLHGAEIGKHNWKQVLHTVIETS